MKKGFIAAAVLIALYVVGTFAAGTSINGSRTIQSTVNYCADAGMSDSYACNMTPALTAYNTGSCYTFKANTANTGTASIAFNALSAITIVKVAGGITTTLADNDIRAGQLVSISYDGTNMQLQSTLGNAASSGVTSVNGQTGAVTGTGAALVLIQQHTTGGAGEVDFPSTDTPPCISSTYDDYRIDIVGGSMNTNMDTLNLQVSTDGTTYITSGYLSMVAGWQLDTASSGTGTSTSGILLVNTYGTGVTRGSIAATVRMFKPAEATNDKIFNGQIVTPISDGHWYNLQLGGVYNAATAILGFRIKTGSGNFSGTVRCYGIAKS